MYKEKIEATEQRTLINEQTHPMESHRGVHGQTAELQCTQMYMTNERQRTMANRGAAARRTQQDPFIYMLSEVVRHSLHP